MWVLAAAFGQIGPLVWENPAQTNWKMVGWQSLAAIVTGFGTAVLASGILPVLENLFRITTDISWLEMADLNHPLLKRLSLEAPGTYHHCLAVDNLAEAAAEAVDANATWAGSALFSTSVKQRPEYFTENMRPGHNPHDELTPTMSALIIIAHVKEGVDLALKNKLNSEIVDVIQQHHGTSLVSYFYQRALQQQNDARLGGKIMNMRPEDIPDVKEESFRYPGPRPQTKEIAIIISPRCKSASAHGRPTPQRIEDLIRDHRFIGEHQLDEAPLTLDEIRKIAESFRFTLINMLHARIAYPAKRDEKEPSTITVRGEQKSAA
jgi:putative nucleotidyltransferase with HDIG domain